MKTAVIGFPRIGEFRELKKATEAYFKKKITQNELQKKAKEIRKKHWELQKENGIDFISSNDFSFYDNFLDTCVMFDLVEEKYKLDKLSELDQYFAMARGYQNDGIDLKAFPMKKWFNTNYHYVLPKIDKNKTMNLNSEKILTEYLEAKELGIETKPVIIGLFTMAKLLDIDLESSQYIEMRKMYINLLEELNTAKVSWVQIDEPYLVMDINEKEKEKVIDSYNEILSNKYSVKVILQTYFGDIRDIYEEIMKIDFDGIGLDFVEGEKTLELIKKSGFPKDKLLFAGIVNGKNIWKNDYKKSLEILESLPVLKKNIVLNTSCSLLHTPFTIENEIKMKDKYKKQFAFAIEKLTELNELREIIAGNEKIFERNQNIINERKNDNKYYFEEIRKIVNEINKNDYKRKDDFFSRNKVQRQKYNLPDYPSTTIGSFPQTSEIRKLRKAYKNKNISYDHYTSAITEKMKFWLDLQEEIGLDVLVHGEFERNDMVEYFGENLTGFVFTENAWVQSYGTRAVKPPIIFGDIRREKDFTVDWILKAKEYSSKEVKGMLTGPVTILNWSFPREDMAAKDIAYQIAYAIKQEVMDLEKSGIGIIQIDEAALREKMPLRKQDWNEKYLDWAIKSFRYVCADVRADTQIHTHMCYSQFGDIIEEIKAMDADVITIESAKSDLEMLDILSENGYEKEIGPGLYDIHSPRIPSVEEFKVNIEKMSKKISKEKLWINPDCGLKTRGEQETVESLKNMVEAAKQLR